jgi:tyrosyl-tRNA synthetase
MKSPYEYWQFWRNTDDADVERFLKLFTTLPLDEVKRLAALQGAEINEAKKALADAATALLHGADAAAMAAETARQTFEEGAIAENLPTVIMREDVQKLFEGADGVSVLIAAQNAGLVKSLGEARRAVDGRGLKVNDVTVSNVVMTLNPSNLTPEGVIKLSLGKKRHVLLRPA